MPNKNKNSPKKNFIFINIILIDDLNTEAKKNEEIKESLSQEINELRDQLTNNNTKSKKGGDRMVPEDKKEDDISINEKDSSSASAAAAAETTKVNEA